MVEAVWTENNGEPLTDGEGGWRGQWAFQQVQAAWLPLEEYSVDVRVELRIPGLGVPQAQRGPGWRPGKLAPSQVLEAAHGAPIWEVLRPQQSGGWGRACPHPVHGAIFGDVQSPGWLPAGGRGLALLHPLQGDGLFLERRWPWDLVPQPKVVGWLGSWAPRNPKTWR